MAAISEKIPDQATTFPTSPSSPFADGYDIDGERDALAEFLNQDTLDPTSPLYPRAVELEKREGELDRLRTGFTKRNAANTEVSESDSASFNEMGKLTDQAADSIDIHTLHAARLFLGRDTAPGENGFGMTGGKKVASCLRSIWHLSSQDNPYADHILIWATESMDAVRRKMEVQGKEIGNNLAELQNRGIRFSVMSNPKPLRVDIGFRSPYGYYVILLINQFDYFTRQIRTLVSKSLQTDRQGRDTIYLMAREIRKIFEEVVRYQRYLTRTELLPLSRGDYLASDPMAKKRVQAATALFGPIQRDVLNGVIVPRHSKRRINLTEAELRLLNDVPLTSDDEIELPASLVQ